MPYDFNENEMAVEILDFARVYSDDFPRELTIADIDFSGAYKIFVAYNIFELDINNYVEVIEILENNSVIIYEVPIFFENGDVYVANIQRAFPIDEGAKEIFSEDELAEYEQRAGNWVVSVMSQYLADDAPFFDFYGIVQDSINATGVSPIFVGGLPYFRNAVALFPDENGDVGRLIPINPPAFIWHDLSAFKDEYLLKGWLDYSRVKEYIRAHPLEVDPDLSGGGSGSFLSDVPDTATFSGWIIIAALFGFLVMVTFVTVILKKTRR